MADPFSWARSLAAAFRIDLSTLKRDAKRLHRAAPEVFGQGFPLNRCQEAVARMRGHKSWDEALLAASKAASKIPPWLEPKHNDAYQAMLGALATLEVETREDAGCLFRGELSDSVPPALVLWSQEMIWRKVSGLVLIDTRAATVQDTALWPAATHLGLTDVLQACRVLDLRESRCPVALSARGRDWLTSLRFALGEPHARTLESSGILVTLESLLAGFARQNGWVPDKRGEDEGPLMPFALIERAVKFVRYNGGDIPTELEGDKQADSIRHNVNKYIRAARRDSEATAALNALGQLVDDLDEKQFGLGRVFSQESQWRPTIALFSSDDPASSALASVVHSLYYWRYVGWELRHTGIEPRPVLYVGDDGAGTLPGWLTYTSFTRGVIAPGPAYSLPEGDAGYLHRSAILISCADGAIASSGKKAPIEGEPAALML
jgi:hypothetical protein